MFLILHITFIACVSVTTSENNHLLRLLPNYVGIGVQSNRMQSTSISSVSHILIKRHVDFRERFLERQRQRQIKDRKLVLEKDAVVKDIEVIDDITHHRKTGDMTTDKWIKILSIEDDFRHLIAMSDMKYTYKRDMHWRTWRNIANGSKNKIVCYKCNNLQVNGTGCLNCGMWTIEERPPPCPYEFYSVVSDTDLCGVNYTQYSNIDSACPSVIKFSELTATCDNPIETYYKFSKMYGVTDSNENIICNGKDYCEISTIYEITPQHVIFRIINSTNDVIYSRIMKPNNNNYICIDDCGRFNPDTKKVARSDKPLKLNLFSLRKSDPEKPLNEMNDGIPVTESILSVPSAETEMSVSKSGANDVDLNENNMEWAELKLHRSESE
nr:uncharacterized protein LOC110383321 [Helicoverpa armigera]